jgi:hypothetical protein
VQEHPVGRLARVAPGCEEGPQRPHQVAAALPVVLDQRPNQLPEGREVPGTGQVFEQTLSVHRRSL